MFPNQPLLSFWSFCLICGNSVDQLCNVLSLLPLFLYAPEWHLSCFLILKLMMPLFPLSTFCSSFRHGRIYVYLFNNELHYRMNKQREMSFEFSSNLSTVDLSKHLIIAWIIRKFIQLVNFVTFSVFYFFLGNRVYQCMAEPV